MDTADLLASNPNPKLLHSVFSTCRFRPLSCPRMRGSFILPCTITCASAAPARFMEPEDAVFAGICSLPLWNATARESSSLRSAACACKGNGGRSGRGTGDRGFEPDIGPSLNVLCAAYPGSLSDSRDVPCDWDLA